MVLNENAYYNGQLWCAYELKNEQGHYLEDKRLFMRKESQKNKFICPDCKEHLILCAGPVMEPHFRHHENSGCKGRERIGSGRFPEIRRQLYHMVKRSFPQAVIDFQVKLDQGIVADIMVVDAGKRLVLEYAGYDEKLEFWERKHAWYQQHDIMDVWILSHAQRPLDTITTFEYLVSGASPVLKVFDSHRQILYLKEQFEIPEYGISRLIVHPYKLEDLVLRPDGEFTCDFEARKKQECDRITSQYEEARQKFRQQREERQRQKEFLQKEQAEARERLRQQKEKAAAEAQKPAQVYRRKAGEGPVGKLTMKMTGIGEWWDIPALQGEDWQVRSGNMNRYRYLRSMDGQAAQLEGEEREKMVKGLIYRLEKLTKATQWRTPF